ncbi:hypothetical protein ACEQ8H_004732 [Pleosporales sp. CAS-2024a]
MFDTSPTSPTSPFPLYLLPSLPFRRRRRSSTCTTSTTTSSASTSPPTPTCFLATSPTSHLRCNKCLADLIPLTCIISKGFTGRHGRAYLVSAPDVLVAHSSSRATTAWHAGALPNTLTHKPVSRQLVTGAHTVADISCVQCGTMLGWKYVDAKEESQKYKIGKFILETKRVVRGVEWDEERELHCDGVDDGQEGEDIEFDSQDEDECEDLFTGIWSVELARKRRANKVGRR